MSGPPAARRVEGSWLAPAALAVARRPALWGTGARQVLALAEPGWWRRPPRLPLPPADYLRFRLVTAYGDATRAPEPSDVVTYLGWCRDERRRGAGRRSRGRLDVPSQRRVGR